MTLRGNDPDRSWFADVNRIRMRIWEWGDPAAPPVVCAHGAHDHGRMWDGIAPAVAALGLRVLAVDLRDHGDSGHAASGAVWMATSLDLALFARQVGGGEPVGLLGHSYGAGLLMFVAAVWPELTAWVVSLDGLGPPSAAFADHDLVEMATAGLDAGARARRRGPKVFASQDEMVARRRRSNPRLPEEWLWHLIRHGSREVEGGWRWKAPPMFDIGLPGPFDEHVLDAQHRALRAPLLYLSASEPDTWNEMTPELLAHRLGNLPTARHVPVPGAGHYVHVEQPAFVVEQIAAFLDEVAGA